ncbi:LiaI-LiaF-like domain-containing protein [Massilia sp. TS11]|uniref:LiaI-LiaF-like domain-containing protein n=1 Tax=Massilia sp. TS11 TaxID=2908003 RepID=UPI001EDA68FE|nr:DUF5668 domain-containing protein [Massilia sp. TS11]MCG2584215.1 DUF5668 domain-containing protein [Massilia sp. TS11]
MKDGYSWRGQLLWGLILIAIGAAFLFDRLDMFDMRDLWHYSPLLLVVFGINRLFDYTQVKVLIGGLWMIFMGLWVFANFEGWFDFNFHNSWPLVVVFGGIVMIVEAILKQRGKE